MGTKALSLRAIRGSKYIMIGDTFFKGYTLFDVIHKIPKKRFIVNARQVFDQEGADRVPQAYEIEPERKMDPHFFVTHCMQLVGDIMFSEPAHSISNTLVATFSLPERRQKRRVYRHPFGFSYPFPGSTSSFVSGHHYAKILFPFLTLTCRYRKHSDKFLEGQALETATAWIGLAPFENE
ncbi:hypothetical protein VTO42DRAFT_5035 [Malbranchea cinnamomea]